ncbi:MULTISPECIES: MarR family winged helix-turn-helix transcriptional regulator [Kitasatospora]|uniref:MarR family winged helix-turn-helix transcriptional regulator n=1 Tax=Kitasatospora TaxID=2063 RepID=UPI000C704B72|nr:MarR family transcriptional regulator [Kitasatospora sp. GP30]MDH6142594.1 DNA-binding MarR family transcriptional regulator [Kitasatospora sp. GP30]
MPATPSDDLTQQLVGLFGAVNRRYARELETAAAAQQLTMQQAKALLAADQPVRMRAIADQVHAEPSNVTAIIDRLEQRGLVERRPDPADRRVKLVAATEAGHAVAAALRAGRPWGNDPFSPLSPDQREQLLGMLQLILES